MSYIVGRIAEVLDSFPIDPMEHRGQYYVTAEDAKTMAAAVAADLELSIESTAAYSHADQLHTGWFSRWVTKWFPANPAASSIRRGGEIQNSE